jgi:hypothetical protein
VLVVVAGEEHSLGALRVLRQRGCLFRRHRNRFFTQHVQTAIERSVRNGSVSVRGRGDIDEIDTPSLRLQHFQVITVDSGLGKIPLRGCAPGLVAIDNRDYFEVTRAFASFGVDGCVSLASDETVADKGAT